MKRVNVKNLVTFLSGQFDLDDEDVASALSEFFEREATPTTPGKVFFMKNYSEKSHALFGDTKPLAPKLRELNEEKKKVAGFNMNLSFGPGWVIPAKYAQDIKNFLENEKVNFEEVTRDQYEKNLEKSKKTTPRPSLVKSKPKGLGSERISKPPPPRPPVKKRI